MAIGSCADLPITPIAAVSIGVFASFVSVFGYTTLQPFLEEKFRFLDTCGILNLHGMPGLIGGFSVMIVSLTMDLKVLKASVDPSIAALMVNRSSFAQFTHQSAFVGITLAMSLVTGSLTGLVMNFMKPAKEAFQDSEYFEVPKVNIPSFFLDQTSNSSMSRADVEALLDERLSKSKQV